MPQKTLSYFAILDEEKSPGIAKKIDNTIIAAMRNGLTPKKNIYQNTAKGKINFLRELAREKSDIIIIRFHDILSPLVFFLIISLRLKGINIIIDVPTPRTVAIKEIDTEKSNPTKRLLKKIYNYIFSSWILLPANLIIQYADEGKWFKIGLARKTIKIGNGILVDETTPLKNAPWPNEKLNLIAVAQLADWHGYDRLLHAISAIECKDMDYKIELTIVGDGESLEKLKSLSKELNLKNVFFKGKLSGKDLDQEFEGKHIGVSSLGLYRKGLQEASDLKTREYMARGLFVLGVGSDPDFEDNSLYRILASNSEETETLTNILCSFSNKNFPSPEDIRSYAASNLALEGKLSRILKSLNKN